MLLGDALETAINEMGLTKNAFAKLCVMPNGKALSATAIANLIRTKDIEPEKPTVDAIERVLKRRCKCCGQYTEKENAWNHQTAERGKGGGNRKA